MIKQKETTYTPMYNNYCTHCGGSGLKNKIEPNEDNRCPYCNGTGINVNGKV